jgi:methionyl aminopeptidase
VFSSFQIFTEREMQSLRKAGSILRGCLEHTAAHVKPGISTNELDAIAEEYIVKHGGLPAFKGYNSFPKSLCISVDDECVHGIPGPRVLEEGQIISLDGGVIVDDLYTDACITVPVGKISEDAQHLLATGKKALDAAVTLIKKGTRVGDISSTIQKIVEGAGCSCIPALTGHGLGKTLHQFPDIPNVGKAGTGPTLPAGTLIAVEPIISLGKGQILQDDDGWTLRSKDGSLTCHFEHSLLVTEEGCEVIA